MPGRLSYTTLLRANHSAEFGRYPGFGGRYLGIVRSDGKVIIETFVDLGPSLGRVIKVQAHIKKVKRLKPTFSGFMLMIKKMENFSIFKAPYLEVGAS